jgi:hypothetical protein
LDVRLTDEGIGVCYDDNRVMAFDRSGVMFRVQRPRTLLKIGGLVVMPEGLKVLGDDREFLFGRSGFLISSRIDAYQPKPKTKPTSKGKKR